MKKSILLVFAAIVASVLSACSNSVNFVLINESDSVLEVEYTFVNYYSTPSKMSLTEWNKWFGEKQWREVPQSEYQFDVETRKLKTKIVPNEAVKILSAHDSMYFVENYDGFQIAGIKITGKKGTVIYEGNQLFKQFQEKNYTNRFITYK